MRRLLAERARQTNGHFMSAQSRRDASIRNRLLQICRILSSSGSSRTLRALSHRRCRMHLYRMCGETAFVLPYRPCSFSTPKTVICCRFVIRVTTTMRCGTRFVAMLDVARIQVTPSRTPLHSIGRCLLTCAGLSMPATFPLVCRLAMAVCSIGVARHCWSVSGSLKR